VLLVINPVCQVRPDFLKRFRDSGFCVVDLIKDPLVKRKGNLACGEMKKNAVCSSVAHWHMPEAFIVML